MPYVCLGVRGGCFNSNTKLEMVRISTTKIGFTRPSLIYNHAMTYVYHCICISKRLQTEHITSSNVPLANTTVDVIPSSLQQLLDSSFASAAAGRRDANFDDAPTPNRDSDRHKTWYSDSRHQGASAVQISAPSDVPKRVDSRFRRRRRTAVVPPTSRAC